MNNPWSFHEIIFFSMNSFCIGYFCVIDAILFFSWSCTIFFLSFKDRIKNPAGPDKIIYIYFLKGILKFNIIG